MNTCALTFFCSSEADRLERRLPLVPFPEAAAVYDDANHSQEYEDSRHHSKHSATTEVK